MSITVDQLIDAMKLKNGFPLDPDQEKAIRHGDGPLWIVAGPGTGKTEVLVIRCLKLMCCDSIDPRSIIVTSFTEKAAKNLDDRISEGMLFLAGLYPELKDLDISQLNTGTLHSLCNDIMQTYGYIEYQNLRLFNDIESQMFVRDNIDDILSSGEVSLMDHFRFMFKNNPRPNKWHKTKMLKTLFDRIVEDRLNVSSLLSSSKPFQELAHAYNEYNKMLNDKFYCDFSHLQKYFLEFLSSPQGELFIKGNSSFPPISHILVDEYQDTNPIQEEIYFMLSKFGQHNLTVVGDDDQALYRFRGGTVECMVSFKEQCQKRWGLTPELVTLVENHRSNTGIVEFCNTYITSYPQMSKARIAGKPLLKSASGRTGKHPNVSHIKEKNMSNLAYAFAKLVKDLHDNKVIQDYNQCVLLLESTKDSPRRAGPYIDALSAIGIPTYNPRSKSFLEQTEVKQLLGAFISIIDPDLDYIRSSPMLVNNLTMVTEWVDSYESISPSYLELTKYVRNSIINISKMSSDTRITSAIPMILYKIMSCEPFSTYQNNPDQDLRLSKVTRLFESFCSLKGRELKTDKNKPGCVNNYWLGLFYYLFCGYLSLEGVNDDEDDEVICPPGRLPIMTIHQSKGLQFDFVFVGSLGQSIAVTDANNLENMLRPFRVNPPTIVHSVVEAALHDEIRLHFVAYSRAKYALILLVLSTHLRRTGAETASFGVQGGAWLKHNVQLL